MTEKSGNGVARLLEMLHHFVFLGVLVFGGQFRPDVPLPMEFHLTH